MRKREVNLFSNDAIDTLSSWNKLKSDKGKEIINIISDLLKIKKGMVKENAGGIKLYRCGNNEIIISDYFNSDALINLVLTETKCKNKDLIKYENFINLIDTNEEEDYNGTLKNNSILPDLVFKKYVIYHDILSIIRLHLKQKKYRLIEVHNYAGTSYLDTSLGMALNQSLTLNYTYVNIEKKTKIEILLEIEHAGDAI